MKFITVVILALSKITESYVVENILTTIPEVSKDTSHTVSGDVTPIHPDNEVHADDEKSEAHQANLDNVQAHLKNLYNKWYQADFNTVFSRVRSSIYKKKFAIDLKTSSKALDEYEVAQAEYEAKFPNEAADQKSKRIAAILENEKNATKEDIDELLSIGKKLGAAELKYLSAIDAAQNDPNPENTAQEVEAGIHYKDLLARYWSMPEYSYEFTQEIFNARNADSEKDNAVTADVGSN